MTISSSLNAGVSGLNANATRLATISDNIANSATNGYKRNTVDFHAMVVGSERPSGYTAGGVRAATVRLIDQPGALTGTDNATDLAIDGRGFLPVAKPDAITATGAPRTMALMTTGAFRLDADGWLKTTADQVLLGWQALADGTIPVHPRDSISGLTPIRIDTSALAANPTTAAGINVNLPAMATRAGQAGDPLAMSMEYFTPLGASETLHFTFTPTIPAGGASNEWTLTIDDSASGVQIGEYRLEFDTAPATAGHLLDVTTLAGDLYDPATGQIELTLPGGPINLDIGRIGIPGGLSQLAADFVPSPPSRNGSPAAAFVGLEVDGQGNLLGVYDQGFTRVLYRIPVVDVPNPNGLTAVGEQAYQVSLGSGDFYMWNAGDGPVGTIAGYAREESATDVAQELTQLIQTQRAYSSNAKVIQTVDEMLQETTNLKR